MFKKIKSGEIFAVVCVLSLLGQCTYSIGYPWNCEESKEALQKAESEYSEIIESPSTEDTAIKFKLAMDNKFRAEAKVNKLCYSK